ncbi:MAG: glycosyltransferase [Alphaproteobacteria bacterium]|nr:glycosyltransferase [Alphaproteobacteria bacterium]
MTDKTLLSIITICKNEPFIKSTCQSICAQTNQNFEWIIIDGASTDNTLEQIEPFKNRVNTLISEQDNGIYPAMNKGINLASGKYLLFLNGGDLLYNNETIARVLPYLNKASADIFYGDSYRLFENKQDCFIKTYPNTLKKSFFLDNTLAHQSSFIKKELFIKYGPYREDFKIVSDKEKWLCFIDNNAKFSHLPFPCSRFRMNGISRFPSQILKEEKIKMLQEYFPKEILYNSELPYLQALFTKQR